VIVGVVWMLRRLARMPLKAPPRSAVVAG
jgi:hypothetical protein